LKNIFFDFGLKIQPPGKSYQKSEFADVFFVQFSIEINEFLFSVASCEGMAATFLRLT